MSNPVCPKCGGPTVANASKQPGSKSPDFLCADVNCKNEKGYQSGVWNDKGGGGGGKKGWQPKPLIWKSAQLGTAYAWALKQAEEIIIESSKRTKIGFTTADILNGAATIFIAITGNVDPRPPAPPAPPTPPPPPQQSAQNDDDIPF